MPTVRLLLYFPEITRFPCPSLIPFSLHIQLFIACLRRQHQLNLVLFNIYPDAEMHLLLPISLMGLLFSRTLAPPSFSCLVADDNLFMSSCCDPPSQINNHRHKPAQLCFGVADMAVNYIGNNYKSL